MIACVGPANRWRVLASLSGHCKAVGAGASRGGCHEAGHAVKVETQLADVIGHLVEGEGAGAGGGGGVGAGVVGVPHIGGVGGDGAATRRGRHHT